jgi:citrate lyase subunit beta/citryl-CoA lyase
VCLLDAAPAPPRRPRRSLLYLPASDDRRLADARSVPADALMLDLEDAVAPAGKPAARDRACAAVRSRGYGSQEVVVRVNGTDTAWHAEDLRAVCAAGPDAVLVPKVSSAEVVRRLAGQLDELGAPATTQLWVMLETPYAVLRAAEICAASERLTVVVVGTNDLTTDLGAEHVPGRQPLLPSLSLCVLAARATGKVVLDGVHNDLDDTEGFLAECRQGRELGFDGKTLLFPAQVPGANAVFGGEPQQPAPAAAP